MDFLGNEILWLLPLVFWISGIFYLSSNTGSISNTSKYLSPIFNLLFPKSGVEALKNYHLYFRKICHFLGYATLALLAAMFFYNSSINILAKYWQIFAFAVVVVVASADEFKQSFYANRHGSFFDVLLDSVGGLTMILLFWIVVKNYYG